MGAEVARMNAKVTEHVPALGDAAAASHQRFGPATVPDDALPLPNLRRHAADGGAPPRLHSKGQEGVPGVALPTRPVSLPLPLGELLLPLHSLDAEQLLRLCSSRHWSQLEWDAKKPKGLQYTYLGVWAGSRLGGVQQYSNPRACSARTWLGRWRARWWVGGGGWGGWVGIHDSDTACPCRWV